MSAKYNYNMKKTTGTKQHKNKQEKSKCTDLRTFYFIEL